MQKNDNNPQNLKKHLELILDGKEQWDDLNLPLITEHAFLHTNTTEEKEEKILWIEVGILAQEIQIKNGKNRADNFKHWYSKLNFIVLGIRNFGGSSSDHFDELELFRFIDLLVKNDTVGTIEQKALSLSEQSIKEITRLRYLKLTLRLLNSLLLVDANLAGKVNPELLALEHVLP